MAAKGYTATENAFKLRDFITRACRKRSKPRSKFPMIKAGASVYGQRPLRHQIEVLNDTKHQTIAIHMHEIQTSIVDRSS